MAQLINGTTIAGHTAIHAGNLSAHSIATTTYVNTQIANLVNSAPAALDTLNELAAALGNDASFSTTITNSIASKLALSGGNMTGNINWAQTDRGITWGMNTDGAYIKFFNTGDGDSDSRLEYSTSDNGDEYHRWMISSVEKMTLKGDGLRVANTIYASGGNSGNWNTAYGWGNHASAGYLTSLPSHNHDDRYYTETEINNFSYWRNDEARTIKTLYFTGVGGDSGNTSNHGYAIYQQGGSWTHPYPDLHIGYHTGIKLGANTGYGGIRFYSDSDMATQLFSVGDGDSHVKVQNNLYVYGNSYLGNGNGDEVHINDILRIGATDSGDAHIFFGEGGSAGSDYGAHLYWDSGYDFYWYTRNAGSDSTLFNYATNNTTYVNWYRHFHMQNREINYVNQVHFNDNVRLYQNGDDRYLNFKWGNSGAGGMMFWDGDGSRQGYVYGSGTGSFGLLDSAGNWKVRVDTSDVEMYGTQYLTTVYANIIYDRDNSAYYINPASQSKLYQLGLGGASPDASLSVSGTAHVDGTLYLGGTAGTVNSWGTRTTGSSGYWRNSSRDVTFVNDGYGSTWTFAIASDGKVTLNRHIDANTTWGSAGTTIFMGWYGSKIMLGNNNDSAHDWANAIGGNSIISTNKHHFYKGAYIKNNVDGAEVLAVDGVNGRLFTVTDAVLDTIYSVNTIAGLPILEIMANNTVKIGKYGANSITISNSRIAINSDTVDTNFPFYVSDRSTSANRYTLANPGMGFNLADNYAQLQLYGPSGAYIDFVTAANDYSGRIIWGSSRFTITGAMWGDMYNASGAAYATQAWVQAQGYRTTDSDSQTLSISGSTLSISGGNSVTLPTGGITAETDTLATVTGRGASTASQVSFTKTDDHAISVGTIRGRAVGNQSGEFIQLYERVNIGGPNGWGAANTAAPTYGLSVFGGANIGYGNSASLFAYAYRGNSNVAGTGEASHHPAGIYSTGTNWLYGTMYLNGNDVYDINGIRAYYYYDRSDTGYYVRPSGISRVYGLAIRGDASGTDTSNQIFFWGEGNSTTSAIGFKSNGGNFTNPTGNGDGYNTYFTMDSDGRGWVFRRGTGGSNFSSAYTSGWILNNGVWQANASMRAPIFYDSDDTGYYGNFSGTSRLNELNLGTTNTRIRAQDGVGYLRIYGSASNYLAIGPYDNNGWAYFETSAISSGVYFNTAGRYAFDTADITPYTDAENSLGNASYRWAQIYTSGWLRQYGAQGMYNQDYGTHFYSNGGSSWGITGSGGNVELQFRSNHQSTLRGYVYADTGNNIGFLNNGGSWSLRTDSSRNTILYGQLTVGQDVGYSSIYMYDSDEGTREIHCNSNRIGFLNQSSSWGAWADDSGNWYAPIFYDADNASYYGDFNSTSRVYHIHADYLSVGQSINTSYRIITNGDYYANGGGNFWAEGRFKQYRGSGTWHDVIDSGNIGSQSVSYASNSGAVSGVGISTLRGLIGYNSVDFYVNGAADKYYPVVISLGGQFGMNRYSITRGYSDPAPWDPIGTGSHRGGLTLTFDASSDIAWGGNDKSWRIIQFSEQYTTMVAGMALPVTDGIIVWLRGGGAYYRLQGPNGVNHSATVYYGTYTAANGATYDVRSDTSNVSSEILSKWPIRNFGNGDIFVNNQAVIHAGNIGSQSVSYASNADTVDGYHATAFPYRSGGSSGYYQVGDWMQFNTTAGLYWPSYNSAHIYPNTSTSYGSIRIDGSRSSWRGITFDGSVTLMMNDNESGHYKDSYGWQFRWENGTLYCHKNSYGGGTSATVLDNSNAPYAWNMNQYVRTSDAPTFSGVYTNDWFRANGCTGLYFQSYGYGLRAPECEGNNYGNVVTYGTGRNGWSGYGVTASFTLMGRSGTDIGLHDNGSSWIFYSPYGSQRLSIGGSSNDPAYRLYVNGAIYATDDIVAFSDRRKKTDIITIDNALEKVSQMRGVYFTKIDSPEKGRQTGVIAQEINEILPEVVTYAETVDEYGVAYGNIAGVLIEAIKEQQRQIADLKEEIKKLRGE